MVGAGNGAQGSKEMMEGTRNGYRLSQRVEAYGVPSGFTLPAPVIRIESALSV